MMRNDLIDYCSNATEREDFVGIEITFDIDSNEYKPNITFPYGYQYKSQEDIIYLIEALSEYKREQQNLGSLNIAEEDFQKFPIKEYMYIIQNYLLNGYYTERESTYASRSIGKINWGRTIKKEVPVIQDMDAIYLKFQTRLHYFNNEHIITEINKYCVYDSLVKFGWYYGLSAIPKSTNIVFNKNMFISILKNKIRKTNKDVDKLLIQSMINIIDNNSGYNDSPQAFSFGTRRFELVWENLVEKTFGTIKGEEKKKYFPKAVWQINDNSQYTNSLLPDTIMINYKTKNLYIIDAKYYRYGIKGKDIKYLPSISSIVKQVVYAEYIANTDELKHSSEKIRNIFILPFDASKTNDRAYKFIGKAVIDWFTSNHDYNSIYAILVDTKHLITNKTSSNIKEILNLSNIIENNIPYKNH